MTTSFVGPLASAETGIEFSEATPLTTYNKQELMSAEFNRTLYEFGKRQNEL